MTKANRRQAAATILGLTPDIVRWLLIAVQRQRMKREKDLEAAVLRDRPSQIISMLSTNLERAQAVEKIAVELAGLWPDLILGGSLKKHTAGQPLREDAIRVKANL